LLDRHLACLDRLVFGTSGRGNLPSDEDRWLNVDEEGGTSSNSTYNG